MHNEKDTPQAMRICFEWFSPSNRTENDVIRINKNVDPEHLVGKRDQP